MGYCQYFRLSKWVSICVFHYNYYFRVLIENIEEIQKIYFNSYYFLLDVIGSFPFFDLLMLFFGHMPVIRISRLVRGIKLFQTDGHSKLPSHPHLFELFQMIAIFFTLIHFVACGYFAFTLYEGFSVISLATTTATISGTNLAGQIPNLNGIKLEQVYMVKTISYVYKSTEDQLPKMNLLSETSNTPGYSWLPDESYKDANVVHQYLRSLFFATSFTSVLFLILFFYNFRA